MQRSVNPLFLHFQELHNVLVSNLLQNYVKSTRMPGKQSAFVFQKIFYSMQFLRQPSPPPYKESFHSNNLPLQRLH